MVVLPEFALPIAASGRCDRLAQSFVPQNGHQYLRTEAYRNGYRVAAIPPSFPPVFHQEEISSISSRYSVFKLLIALATADSYCLE